MTLLLLLLSHTKDTIFYLIFNAFDGVESQSLKTEVNLEMCVKQVVQKEEWRRNGGKMEILIVEDVSWKDNTYGSGVW